MGIDIQTQRLKALSSFAIGDIAKAIP